MPRYLTPAKICLLLLVDLYVSDEIPSSSKLDVLSFVSSQVNAPSDNDHDSIEERINLASSGFAIFGEKLSRWQSGIPGRSVYDILLQRVWTLDELDSLHNLFQQLGELVNPPESDTEEQTVAKVSRSSPLGQYIRRCVVEFTRLQFADSQALWNAFASYRAPYHEAWASRNPEAAQKRDDERPAWARSTPANAADTGYQQPAYASTDDSDTILSFSIYQLQKLGSRVPSEVKSKLDQWISEQYESSAQSLQHFMAFFEHWRASQYTMALESLHRYFDYSLIAKGGGAENMKVYYQYALLHLSVLHADFECWEESVDAMDECIATARENQDTECLNFALSWLLYLRQAHPDNNAVSFENLARLVGGGNSDQDEITFLKSKARESKHWSLMSSTLLEEAKMDMYSSGSSVKAFEHILQASYLDVQHDLRTLMPASTLFHGASFDRLGQASLSTHIYESVKTLHAQHRPLNDRVRGSCRVAYNLAQSGLYDAAMQLLDSLEGDVRGVLKLQQRAQAFKALVQLKRHLRKDDIEAANYFLEYLRPVRSFGDPEIQFEISLLEIDLLVKQEDYEMALQMVNKHIAALKRKSGADIAQRLHLLVLKAKIFAAGGQHIKGFSITLRAASIAERYSLISILKEALGVLCAILNELSEFEAAKDMAEAALPSALENRDLEVRAQLFSHLAESHVGITGTSASGSSEQSRNVRTAQMNVERSYEAYEKIEDVSGMLDCLIMKGKLARWKGDDATATQADERYLQILADTESPRRDR